MHKSQYKMSLDSAIKNSKGYSISQTINQFYLTKHIFKHNYIELSVHLEKQIEPVFAFKLAHTENREELQPMQLETIRLLHNFLASAYSLVDHTRNFQRKLFSETDPFTVEYQNQVDEKFKGCSLACFMKDFRQYIQHFQTPMISTTFSLTDKVEDMKSRIIIAKSTLLEYSNWTSNAKKFIANLDKDLDIPETVTEYYNLVFNFQAWFEKRQTEIFAKDLKELDKLRNDVIMEHVRETVNQFVNSDNVDNNFFLVNVTKFFSSEQKEYYAKSPYNVKLDFLIWVLKTNKLISTVEEELIIRKKLTY